MVRRLVAVVGIAFVGLLGGMGGNVLMEALRARKCPSFLRQEREVWLSHLHRFEDQERARGTPSDESREMWLRLRFRADHPDYSHSLREISGLRSEISALEDDVEDAESLAEEALIVAYEVESRRPW